MGNVDDLRKSHLGRSRDPDHRIASPRPLPTRCAGTQSYAQIYCVTTVFIAQSPGGTAPESELPTLAATPGHSAPSTTSTRSGNNSDIQAFSKFGDVSEADAGLCRRRIYADDAPNIDRELRGYRRRSRSDNDFLRVAATTGAPLKPPLPGHFEPL